MELLRNLHLFEGALHELDRVIIEINRLSLSTKPCSLKSQEEQMESLLIHDAPTLKMAKESSSSLTRRGSTYGQFKLILG